MIVTEATFTAAPYSRGISRRFTSSDEGKLRNEIASQSSAKVRSVVLVTTQDKSAAQNGLNIVTTTTCTATFDGHVSSKQVADILNRTGLVYMRFGPVHTEVKTMASV